MAGRIQQHPLEGHAVGNHTYSHPVRAFVSHREAAEDITRGAKVIGQILGREVTLFRPPMGKITGRDLWWSWRSGLTVVLWNVDPKDYKQETADTVRAWFRQRPLAGGDLVLLHDVWPWLKKP